MRNKAGHGKCILTPDVSCFENSVDPDQLASLKPADQGQHRFPQF